MGMAVGMFVGSRDGICDGESVGIEGVYVGVSDGIAVGDLRG